MSNKKVSVIVPVYNGEKYIKRCIHSLLRQDYSNFEVIIVNDGSKDCTKQICTNIEQSNSCVKLVSIENCGVSAARNIGVQNSRGDYISFVDSDDYVDSKYISTLVKNLERKNADISVCNYYYVVNDVPHPIMFPKIYCGLIGQERFFAGLIDDCYRGFLWNKMFRRELLYTEGEIIKIKKEISICEDLLFVATIASRANRFYIEDRPLYYYIQLQSSAYNSSFKRSRLTEITAYNELIHIIQDSAPALLSKYKESYLKMALKIAEGYKYAVQTEKAPDIEQTINDAVKRYYYEVMKQESISIKKKIYYTFYKKFPQVIHLVKQIYHRIRY